MTPDEISSYGCAEPEDLGDGLRRVRDVVEKPRARRRAVEPRGHRSLRVHARDLRRARPHRARRRRRAAAHRRDRAAARIGVGVRPRVHRTAATTSARSSTSSAPTSSSRSTAPDLGPALADYLRATGARPVVVITMPRDPARRRASRDPRRGDTASRRSTVALRDALRSRARRAGRRARAGAAVREHRDGRLRGARRRHRGRGRRRTGAAARRRRAARPVTRPRSRSAPARRSAS